MMIFDETPNKTTFALTYQEEGNELLKVIRECVGAVAIRFEYDVVNHTFTYCIPRYQKVLRFTEYEISTHLDELKDYIRAELTDV